ncbi:hypothetical protein ACJJIW_13115 [Microbulbifer sp. JMSA004]|uniref:hypothetical protein n=1 Tax=unclassified Microbulbifer TaxID=2619833 RepID=UPI0024ACB4A5|nr:hypothetical protein [Microbulbifer sp. VAAF005]WHI46242.1 hypothetical protein P0078_21385 [Microbulbifer sp. VAAF005]
MKDKLKIQKVIDELYSGISGPAGFKRDWKRQESLFTSDAKMIRTFVDSNGMPQSTILTVQEYPENFENLIAGRPFYEIEIHNIIERFGNIAHAFSIYEAWSDKERTQFIKRGVNSIQLLNDGESWKVVHMIWDDERSGLTMDSKYNPAALPESSL